MHSALTRAMEEDDRGEPFPEGQDCVIAAFGPLLQHDQGGDERLQLSAYAFQVRFTLREVFPAEEGARADQVPLQHGGEYSFRLCLIARPHEPRKLLELVGDL